MIRTRLVRNRIRCKVCGDVIESKSRHDFQVCRCWGGADGGAHGGVAVDGGLDYSRWVGRLEDIEDLSEYEEVDDGGQDVA